MNINDTQAIRQCTSCQMCAAVCPKNAINIALDKDGFYRPAVDDNLCIDCGLCTKVCYKFENEIPEYSKEKLSSTTLYAASAKDLDVVKNTTSGGLADLLARELIKEGYKCVGVIYDSESDCVKDYITDKEDELDLFRGSKYIQSYTLDAFKEVVKNCGHNKYAIFGTPCHIYALDKYLRLKNRREQCILIDLYCHGCPSMNIWKKYVTEIKNKTGYSRIDNVNFRSKIKGWGNFYVVVVVVVDGQPVYYSDVQHNEFFDLFFSDQLLNSACNDCKLKGTLEHTDIRLGDFWGKQYVLNNKGVSAVSLVSDKAKILFNKITDEIIFREEEYKDFLPWQSWGKEHKPDIKLREQLLSELRNENILLKESLNTVYQHQTIVQKIIRLCKNIVHLLPSSVEKRIRWLFYKL